MPSSTSKSMILPVDVALTKRSRKFYDGTYKWNSEGFTDEHGVYRKFDCYDAAARAPTPLPPMFPGELEEESTDDLRDQQPVANPEIFTFASNSSSKGGMVTIRRDELFHGHKDRDRLIGKMEGILITCRHTGTELSLEECYRLCGIPDSAIRVEKTGNRETTPPQSPEKGQTAVAKSDMQGQSPGRIGEGSTRHSDFSDCPSDLSDWDVQDQVKSGKEAPPPADTRRNKQDKPDGDAKPTRKTTRGVAQKIRKGAKASSRTQSSNATPALFSLQSEGFTGASSNDTTQRRRSSRQGNAQSGK
ncbi:uncharacterized protein K460DRAFT_408138 [Cucurbitaria berberidis CBS 394.84]|uniref:Uncharacterized protein n=1 Tax=Cucurbitaria berberidis CBS 394.84 TaxID=1168544 RepID=A0A9P4L6C7_9PLEO|nr:uncharacterized protein K460DRAFT_408138 [Cucurbitaria berberidis CBS 394.84]KAF1843816.1 hypothetical protein K460DRAFT_408138 [Cucurbitaria berberidis CBS 394.84]